MLKCWRLPVILVYGWLLSLLMIKDGTIPSDWKNSSIINIYKVKGDVLIRGKHKSLKLLDHATKGLERVMKKIIRKRVFINDMQFGFLPAWDTIEAIFILRLCTYNNTRSEVRVNNTTVMNLKLKSSFYPSTFLQPVNSSKNSIKLSFETQSLQVFLYVCLENPRQIFYSFTPLILLLWASNTYKNKQT